jgi:uncharacterized protein YbbC (DUF1343 family)
MVGADVLIRENLDLIKGKKIGIVTNHTAVLNNGIHLVDTLYKIDGTNIIALYGPEHGIRGSAPAGEKISDEVDEKTNIPVYSLYGQTRKPTTEMLKDVEVLIFDIQDVGARFYTYISTLFYTIEAGAENNIPVIILDRPNPINGKYVDGPIREKELTSFVGIAPIPITHGMTIGELSEYFVGEKLIKKADAANLTVIKMQNWNRNLFFDECDLKWLPPSPNIPDLETAIVYPGTCLIEGVNVSEGRGTMKPFLTIGAPYIISSELISELKSLNIDGISISPAAFTPIDIKEMASNPKYKGIECYGISISVTDRKKFESVKFGIKLVYALKKLYKEFEFRESSFERLSGSKELLKQIKAGIQPDDIFKTWKSGLDNFIKTREKYLIY